MKISENTKAIVVSCVFLLGLTVIWFMFLYKPQASELRILKEETEGLFLKLQSLRATKEQIAVLEQQVEKLSNEVRDAGQKVAPKESLPQLVQHLKKKGTGHGLTFHNIIPDFESLIAAGGNSTDVLKLTLHLKLQGEYLNIGRYIASLGDLPFYVSVGDILLTYNHRIHPEVDVTLDLNVFLADDAAKKSGIGAENG
jgi:Tfp pilus assembly protein PilO